MTFAKLCREADKKRRRKQRGPRLELMADDVSLVHGRAAESTVEALVYQLRKGGAELSNSNARRRLFELSEQQLHEVSVRLQKFMPHIARAWTPSEVELLVQLWSDVHG